MTAEYFSSPLHNQLEEKCGHYYLLGDSGYPHEKNLLTPFKDRDQLTCKQINYNLKLSKSRYGIEHCFSVLIQKFCQVKDITFIVHFV
jgi:hypothetical protein